MFAGGKIGVMQPSAKHKGLCIQWCKIACHLLEPFPGLIGILVRQGGFAAEPRVFRQRNRIKPSPFALPWNNATPNNI
jgi:hypothetical protein